MAGYGSAFAYGSRAYGSGLPVSFGRTKTATAAAAGKSTVTFGMAPVVRTGDIYVYPAPKPNGTTPEPAGILAAPATNQQSFSTGSAGRASGSINTGNRQSVSSLAAGSATGRSVLGVTITYRAGQVPPAGMGGSSLNNLQVIPRQNGFVVFASYPPYLDRDVLVTPNSGPGSGNRSNSSMVGGFFIGQDMLGGDTQKAPDRTTGQLFAISAARATVTMGMGARFQVRSTSSGVATSPTNRLGVNYSQQVTSRGVAAATRNYLSSPSRFDSTAAGRGGARDQLGSVGFWYLGSSTQMSATAVGRANARDQFGTLGKWYLGSSTQMALTSAGVAAFTQFRISQGWYLAMTPAGRGGARDQFGTLGKWYLGSSTRMASIAAGRGGSTRNYLSSPVALSTAISNGRAATNVYLGSPFHVTSTAYAQAHVNVYLSSRVYFAGTSPGRSTAYCYMGSPLRTSLTSNGRAGSTYNYLASPYRVSSIAYGQGGSTYNYLSTPVRLAAAANGRAAIANYLAGPTGLYMKVDWFSGGGGTWYLAGPVSLKSKVFALGNFIFESELGIRRLYSYSAGRSYNLLVVPGVTGGVMLARADAGCRAFTGWLADTNPAYFNKGFDFPYFYEPYYVGLTGPAGVSFYETGKTYMRCKPAAGAAHMQENEEFIPWNFKMHVHAGCNGYGVDDLSDGNVYRQYNRAGLTSNQPGAVYPDDYLPETLRGQQRPEEDDPKRLYEITNYRLGTGVDTSSYRRGGVFMYLSSTLQFQNSDPNHCGVYPYSTPSTLQGRSGMTAQFDPQFDLKARAGCLVGGSHYVADYDPEFFVNRDGINGYTGPDSGVKMYQTGVTQMRAQTERYYYYIPSMASFQMGVTYQRFAHTFFRGSGYMRLRDPNTIFVNGLGNLPFNYISNASYNKQRWQSWDDGDGYPLLWDNPYDSRRRRAGGVGHYDMYAAGRLEMAPVTSNGVGGSIDNYIASRVYPETTIHGKSGPNSIDGESQNERLKIFAGCYPWYYITKPTDTDPGGTVVYQPGVKFSQDRVNPSLETRILYNISTMTIEINGIPILRVRPHGVATAKAQPDIAKQSHYAIAHAGCYGAQSYIGANGLYYGYYYDYQAQFSGRNYGVVIEQYQRHDILIDGVANWDGPLGIAYLLVWSKRGEQSYPRANGQFYTLPFPTYGGEAQVTIQDNRRFMAFQTAINHVLYYGPQGQPVYSVYLPDRWDMIVNWALRMRSRGRTRFYADRVFGNLLHRVHKAPQPGIPNIDGQPTPPYGQYWPRQTVLPWPTIRTPHPDWADYEYARR